VVGSWLAAPALWWNGIAVLVALIPIPDAFVRPACRGVWRHGSLLHPLTFDVAGIVPTPGLQA
jgi:hypothetical protein